MSKLPTEMRGRSDVVARRDRIAEEQKTRR